MADLDTAAAQFPVAAWLAAHGLQVRDGGGANLYADCPVCGGKSKLRLKRENLRWTCFKCDEGGHGQGIWRGWGSIYSLVQHLEGLSFGQAVRFVCERAGVPDTPVHREGPPRYKIPREAFPLLEFPKGHEARKNLRKRGLWHLADRIYGCVDGKYAGRWILPANFLGEVRGIEAKGWHKATTPKSLFPTWFDVSQNVYTTEWEALPFAIVTESIFDAETFRLNAVGIYGSNLKPGQLDRLLELKQRGVSSLFWALDPDAFVKQANAILQKTAPLFKNYLVPLPEFTANNEKADPNALGFEACWGLLEQAQLVESELDLVERKLRAL